MLFDWHGVGITVGMVERMGEIEMDLHGMGDFVGRPFGSFLVAYSQGFVVFCFMG